MRDALSLASSKCTSPTSLYPVFLVESCIIHDIETLFIVCNGLITMQLPDKRMQSIHCQLQATELRANLVHF